MTNRFAIFSLILIFGETKYTTAKKNAATEQYIKGLRSFREQAANMPANN